MGILTKIQEEYNKSKLFFVVKAFLTVATIYFAVRVIYISISGLLNSSVLPNKIIFLLFFMLFFLGLSNLVKVIEMFIYKQKKYFTLQIVITIFILAVSVFIIVI
ncbi:hypothetical protein CSV69_08970 [Sporosarcina sp. P26b]|nr:hypothetical protein CSV69_08970 [Sporosarcina sp. P26b]